MSTCGKLDLYDNEDGSILIAWGTFGIVPDSFNIYVNGVLFANVTSFDGQLLEEDGFNLLVETSSLMLTESSASLPIGLTTVTGLTQTSYNAAAVAAATGNSLRPQNMPPNGVVTPPGTYRFNVTAVLGGLEVGTSPYATLTTQPTSLALITPMKRLWPFPNTGLD